MKKLLAAVMAACVGAIGAAGLSACSQEMGEVP